MEVPVTAERKVRSCISAWGTKTFPKNLIWKSVGAICRVRSITDRFAFVPVGKRFGWEANPPKPREPSRSAHEFNEAFLSSSTPHARKMFSSLIGSVSGSPDRVRALRRFAITITIVTLLGHIYIGFETSYACTVVSVLSACTVQLV